MRTQLGGLVFPVFAALLWLPIVWATLRWWLRDMLRAAKGPSRGKHAKEPAPGLALFSLAIVVGILAAVVYPSWQQRVALAQDWWQGPVRHDNVRCVVKGDLSSLSTLKSQSWKFAEFDLVGEDGYSQHFMLKFADLDRETDRIDSPFNTGCGRMRVAVDDDDCACLPAHGHHRRGVGEQVEQAELRGWCSSTRPGCGMRLKAWGVRWGYGIDRDKPPTRPAQTCL